MKRLKEILIIILGTAIVSFAICNIHSALHISEGGELGLELLCLNWFNISPSITSIIFDIIFYTLGSIILGKKFLVNAFIGTFFYSIFYLIFENNPIDLSFLANHLLLASLLGGILVGVGCGLIVRYYGSCGGDDSLALIINHFTKLPISICYFIMDVIVILLSLTYIPLSSSIYSLITAFTSSMIIGLVSEYKNKNLKNNK